MKILIAEDDAVSRHLLESLLAKWGYEVVAAVNGADAWRLLQAEDSPSLAILDWMMPEMDGVEICRNLRKHSKGEMYTYVILLTARELKDDVVEGMEAGADDYITKPFHPHELKVRLRAGLRILELQEELVSAREMLREKASRDSLTGLWNHEEIIRILKTELSRDSRVGGTVGVVMADLDRFKNINDTYGHISGDAVLRQAAARIITHCRDYDAVGRYGGEEFLFILPGSDMEDAADFAERIRTIICGGKMDTPEGPITVTTSLGVAVGGADTDAMSVISAADKALYRAKEKGRNRVETSALP